jgi:hypothetical protein
MLDTRPWMLDTRAASVRGVYFRFLYFVSVFFTFLYFAFVSFTFLSYNGAISLAMALPSCLGALKSIDGSDLPS